jgi:hypothetical protein
VLLPGADYVLMHIEAQRRQFLAYFGGLGLSSTLLPGVLWGTLQEQNAQRVTLEMLRDAAAVADLAFTDRELDAMLAGVNQNLTTYAELRSVRADNSLAPPLYFNPIVPGMTIERVRRPFKASKPPSVTRPRNLEEVAFWPVTHIGRLLQTKQVKSLELTEMYLARLRRYDSALTCVVTLTEDLARRQASDADREIAAGRYRGPLHGVPWGVKDLCATRDYPTTWGAVGLIRSGGRVSSVDSLSGTSSSRVLPAMVVES